MKLISQREAHRLRKRVAELEARNTHNLNRWALDWCGGIHIDRIVVSNTEVNIARTARALSFAIVVIPSMAEDRFDLYAVQP